MGFTGRPLERVCTTELGQGAHARKKWFLLEVLYLGITSLYAKKLEDYGSRTLHCPEAHTDKIHPDPI